MPTVLGPHFFSGVIMRAFTLVRASVFSPASSPLARSFWGSSAPGSLSSWLAAASSAVLSFSVVTPGVVARDAPREGVGPSPPPLERKLNGADLGAVGVAAPDGVAEGAPKLNPIVGLSFASAEAADPNAGVAGAAGVTAYFPNMGAGEAAAAGEPVTACFPNIGAGDAAPAAGDPNSEGEAAPETDPNKFVVVVFAPADAPNLIGLSGFQVLSAGSVAAGELATEPKTLEPPEAVVGAPRDTREKRLPAAFGVGAGAPSLSSSASLPFPLEASDRWANGLPSVEPVLPEPGTYSFRTEFGLEVPDRLLLVSLEKSQYRFNLYESILRGKAGSWATGSGSVETSTTASVSGEDFSF